MNYEPVKRLQVLVLIALTFFVYSCKEKGCTYKSALNYDSQAEIDDGGCLFDENPSLNVLSPMTETYGAESLYVQFEAYDDLELKGYRYEIIRAENQEVIYWSQGDLSSSEQKVSEVVFVDPEHKAFEFLSYYGDYLFNLEVSDDGGHEVKETIAYKLIDTVAPTVNFYWSFIHSEWAEPQVVLYVNDLGSISELIFELYKCKDYKPIFLMNGKTETYPARTQYKLSVSYLLASRISGLQPGEQYQVKVSVKDWYENSRIMWTDVGTVQ